MTSPALSPRGRRHAISVLLDQMTVRRPRLACGSIMFAYLVLHFSMHALGNLSFQAMEWSTRFHDAVWRSVPGTVAPYGAFLIHVALALWALYRRRGFRMGGGEWTRLILGFAMLPLLFHHFASERYVHSAFGVERR